MGRKINKQDVLDWLGDIYTIEDLAEIFADVLNGDVLNWLGSDHSKEELAEIVAKILNGELNIKTFKFDIIGYNDW